MASNRYQLLTVISKMNDFRDRGWAWVTVAACFWISLTAVGIISSYGVLYTILTEELHISREAASWPFTIGNSFLGIGACLSCLLNGFFTIRRQAIAAAILCFFGIFVCYFSAHITVICIFFGAVNGIGAGLLNGGCLVIICQYFNRYATVATGLFFAGISTSCIVYPPLIQHLSKKYGVNGCFLIVSGIALNSLVGALFYRSPPLHEETHLQITINRHRNIYLKVNENQNKDVEDMTKSFSKYLVKQLRLWLHIFKYPMFLLITISFELCNFSYFSYLMVINDNALDVGVDKIKAPFLISMFATCELSGRLSSGWIVDLDWIKVKTLLIISYSSLGVIYAIVPILTSYVTLGVSSCLTGYVNGIIGINWTVTLNNYLGFKLLSPAIAVSALIFIFVSLCFPFLIGYFREIGGSYNVLFYMFGIMQFVAAALWLMEPLAVKIQRKTLGIGDISAEKGDCSG